MAERLPSPILQVWFEPTASIPDCLRSALNTARRLQVGVVFEQDGQEYTVQPWMDVEHVLALHDAALAASVREHLEVHERG